MRNSFIWALPVIISFTASTADADVIKKCPDKGRLEGQPGNKQWCVSSDLFGALRKNGPFRAWHKNGQLRVSGQFVDDKRHGSWTVYDGGGQLVLEQQYRFGKLIASTRHSARPEPAFVATPEPSKQDSSGAEIVQASEETTPVSGRDDFDRLGVGTARRGDSEMIAALTTDFAFSKVQGLNIFRPGFHAELGYSSVALEMDWGIAVAEAGGQRFAAPQNPAFYLTYRMKHKYGDVRFGGGAAVPVRKLDFDTREPDADELGRLAAYVAAPLTRGFWNFYLSVPELPTIVMPVWATVRTPYLHLDIEGSTYLPIPINGGSSDLGLQIGVDASYPILDYLRAGARLQFISAGIPNNADPIVGLEPFADVTFGPAFARAGLHLNLSRPGFLNQSPTGSGEGPGVIWGFNMALGVAM